MTTAREAFEARMLASKYGPVGRVAANYRAAGYNVKVLDPAAKESVSFIAWRKGEKLAVRVLIASGPVKVETVNELREAASKEGAKPILVLYGRGPKLTSEALEAARQAGVSLKRFRI